MEFLIDLIIGIPPATAASYNNNTLLCSAILNNSEPLIANRALFAVTTCIFFSRACLTKSKLNPFSSPINSIRTLQSLMFNKSKGFSHQVKFLISHILFLNLFFADTPRILKDKFALEFI